MSFDLLQFPSLKQKKYFVKYFEIFENIAYEIIIWTRNLSRVKKTLRVTLRYSGTTEGCLGRTCFGGGNKKARW